ncbi:MAG: phosphoglycerate dehydrogenase [Melioribacteraceae bacterium]|nr:phosphoglycerate dehydrogenase [Melioribacteraceae bacterium]
MKKVLISEKVNSKLVDILKSNSLDVDYLPDLKKEELSGIIGKYQILVVRSATQVTKELIDKADNLELIGRAGTGVDNIDSDAATKKGIIVMNTPGGNTISAAEHAFSLMLSMCRHIPQADKSMKEGKWDRKSFSGTELFGKNLGVIGLGKIGKEFALRAKAFGMNILGFDPLASSGFADEYGILLVGLEELYANADIITLHVPLTEETKNLIGKETISKCKSGVKIINCARGGLINEPELLEAIKSGKVSSAAIDVYESEPPIYWELINHPKVVATPHLGASTDEAQEKVAVQIANQIVDWVNGNDLVGTVNAVAINLLKDEKVRPYVSLAEKIGSLHVQLLKSNINKIIITYRGQLLGKSSELIKSALLKGILQKMIAQPVNLINAPSLAEAKGIILEEIKSTPDGIYSNLLSVQVISETGTKKIAGTIMLNDDLRIVSIDDFNAEFKPDGNIVLYYNIDKPGVLAKVSSVLSESNINIAGLSLSRFEKGKQAVTVISVDDTPKEDVIEKMKKLEAVTAVFTIKF